MFRGTNMGQQVLAVEITLYPEAFLSFLALCPVATKGCASTSPYALVTYTISWRVSILQQKPRWVHDFAGRALRRAFLVLGEPIYTCPNCNDE